MQCTMDHIVLNVTDDEAMMAFYSNVLMLQAERVDEYRAGRVPFPSVRLGPDTVIDMFPKKMWQSSEPASPGRRNLNHLCMAMVKGQWDELMVRLSDNGVAIDQGPVQRWGAHGTGISVYFRDPEDNTIEARYYDRTNTDDKCLLSS